MQQLQQVLDTADLLYSLDEIDQALNSLAESLTQHYADSNPLLLCVMNGSVVTTGNLLPKLNFPLELDYIHLTRYGDKLVGGELEWLHQLYAHQILTKIIGCLTQKSLKFENSIKIFWKNQIMAHLKSNIENVSYMTVTW